MPRDFSTALPKISGQWLLDRISEVIGQLRVENLNSPILFEFMEMFRESQRLRISDVIDPSDVYTAMMEPLGEWDNEGRKTAALGMQSLLPDLVEHLFVNDHQDFGRCLKEYFYSPVRVQTHVH